MNIASHKLLLMSCIFASISSRTMGFNLALNQRDAKYIVSPVIQSLGERTSPTGPLQLTDDVAPSFFGYSFSLFKTKPKERISLMIGSPKALNPNDPSLERTNFEPMGNIQSCRIRRNLFTGSVAPCTRAHPPDLEQGDGYGLSLLTTPNGQAVACSPTKEQICGLWSYTPGTCYKSKDHGRHWEQDGNTKSLTCPVTTVDVLFVLDGSGSVGTDFVKVKSWVKNIASKLNFTKVSVGVVQYSHYNKNYTMLNQPHIQTHIRIGDYSNYRAFSNEVNKIELHGFTTYTGHALRRIMYDFNSTDNYHKKTNKQVMLLLTDGKATDRNLVPISAKELRDKGVIPYAVGVGNNVNKTELQLIANGEKDNDLRVFEAKNFNDLDRIAKELETEIQNIALEGSSNSKTALNEMEFGEIGLSGKLSRVSTGQSE